MVDIAVFFKELKCAKVLSKEIAYSDYVALG
jgi:hypothetical protein